MSLKDVVGAVVGITTAVTSAVTSPQPDAGDYTRHERQQDRERAAEIERRSTAESRTRDRQSERGRR
jgi:hypothetical protein